MVMSGKRLLGVVSTALLFFLAAPIQATLVHPWDDDEDKKEGESDDDEPKWYAILHGDVVTGTGSMLRGATVLAKDGVIEEIGYDLFLPEGTETLDATGLRVYPGLVAISASSRITQGLFFGENPEHDHEKDLDPHFGIDDIQSQGHSHVGDHEAAEDPAFYDGWTKTDLEESFDPFSEYLVLSLATGITTVEQSNMAVKLTRGEIENVLIGNKNLASFSWNLRTPASIRSTREKFERAAEYLREYAQWRAENEGKKEKERSKEPSRKGVDKSTEAVLKGEMLARFAANDRRDLLGIARFAQRFHFRPVIVGCREGWTVADELGRAGAYAIVTPRDRRPKSEALLRAGGSSIENAAILHRHGVQVAIVPGNTSFELNGIAGRDLLHIAVEAGFAIRGGLPQDAAVAALTTVPARILGVDHQVGTLEVGKDLDAIVTDGDLLHYQTFVQYAVVSGKLVYDKEEEIFFAHIRPRPKPAVDPGEGEGEPAEAAPEEEADSGEDG